MHNYFSQQMSEFHMRLNIYRASGNLSGQIDTLYNLAVISIHLKNKTMGLSYLNEADMLLEGLDDSKFAQLLVEINAKKVEAAEEFVKNRSLRLSRVRQKLAKLK